MILAIIILSILLVLCIYIIINQYFKISKYELLYAESVERFDNSKNMLIRLIELFTAAATRLRRIDTNGSFSSDDEVGFAFKLIDTTIIDLNEKLNAINTILEDDEIEGKED